MFAQRIKDLRKQHNLTQKQLADILFVDQTAISGWENGKTKPDFSKQQLLADYFDISIDYLLGRTNDTKPQSLDEQLDGVEFALFGEMKDMTDAQKKEILDFVKFKKQQDN